MDYITVAEAALLIASVIFLIRGGPANYFLILAIFVELRRGH